VNATAWYAARSAGLLAYLLLSSGAVLGLLLSRRRTPPWPKFAVEDVHRFVTILTGIFIAIHVAAILLDSFVPFSVGQVLVPFASSYRPFATALGIVAVELLLAVALTNLARRRIPYRVWRRAHYATFGVWVAATFHGLLAGTDRHDVWFLLLYVSAVAAVAAAIVSRFVPDAPFGTVSGVATAAVGVAFVLALLPQHAAASHVTTPTPTYSGPISGTIQRGDELQTGDVVSVVGAASGREHVRFRLDLLVAGNTIEETKLELAFPNGATCAGTVDSVDGSGMSGTCTGGGETRSVHANWTIGDGGNVSGRLAVA
jgi:methionine sulfoxide reductase heme-binding subunit